MALTYGFCLGETSSTYTSDEFAEAFSKISGDGVCPYGNKFDLLLSGGMTVRIASGFALADGHWLKNDEPLYLTLSPSSNTEDRYDAIALRVDYTERKVELCTIFGVDPDSPPRSGTEYCVYLYLVNVKRGVTELLEEHITDARDYITQMRDTSADVLYIYDFLDSGIDAEVARLVELSEQDIQRADEAIETANAALSVVHGQTVGDVIYALESPTPVDRWMLCDGGTIPTELPELSALLAGVLPDIPSAGGIVPAWIYGGAPDWAQAGKPYTLTVEDGVLIAVEAETHNNIVLQDKDTGALLMLTLVDGVLTAVEITGELTPMSVYITDAVDGVQYELVSESGQLSLLEV